MERLAAGRLAGARALAEAWSAEAPGDVLALLALGEVWEAAGETAAAARAYGSLIDLFPGRADLRRLAGERLERLGEAGPRPGDRHLREGRRRTGRTTPRAIACSPGPSCAPAASRRPSRRSRRGSRRATRRAASPASTGSCARTSGLLAAAWLRAEPARRERGARPSRGPRRRARERALAALRPHLGDRRQRRRPPRLRPRAATTPTTSSRSSPRAASCTPT